MKLFLCVNIVAFRGYLIRKLHVPRFRGIRRLRTLQTNIDQIAQMAGSLKKEKDTVLKSAASLSTKVRCECKASLNPFFHHIKACEREARPVAFPARREGGV